ncbi:hypothetical protein [Pseudoxanthomonas sp. CF125]|uniref:phage adaptor protein n=1 Tax=Pseudoxanthomonas sp. CF125 TaxID=1855303 RepID=UPI0008850D6B|nr:hypothetical protein [Pseudoxanthomonas sp. CF125]SDQ42120.1 hypothetical protein SAMN05216569_1061 [Pseudoxanthomonas sp. CF125]
MAFTNYNDFRVGVQTLIEGDETAGSTFSVNTLDIFIVLGEARVHDGDNITPGLRASPMVTALSEALTANAADLPDDLLELRDLQFSGEPPLDIVPLDHLKRQIANDFNPSAAASRMAAQDGDSVTFWPETTGTVGGAYYARPAPLEAGLHATFLRYPQVYLYAALYEAALFLGMDSKMSIWEARWRSLMDGANHSERMRVYGGGRLRTRTS